MTLTQSLRSILNQFSKTRNVAVNFAEKQRARDYILKTFRDQGLYTWTEEFQSNNAQYPGINIIGQLPGRYTGSPEDKIVLIGSHYDSVDTTPGVDDNGSGMTALLQALKLYTNPDKINCERNYTLLFVAFDLEERQPACPAQVNCSCPGRPCGSNHFVQNFSRYLISTRANFQGAFILETILNYNTTPMSQDLPPNIAQFFSQVLQEVKSNLFRGDFLAVMGRLVDDNELMNDMTNAFNGNASFKSLAVKIPSPLRDRPERWPPKIQDDLKDFFRSDHFHFWNANPSLPAVFITDTANFRGYMKQCYHQSCDDINHVTPDMIAFLARTTESLVAVASKMTNEKCETKQAANCFQKLTSDKGEITSPYFNTTYPNNVHCVWTIEVDAGQDNLILKFTTFDLEQSENCDADYVEIRDGTDKAAPLIGKYCGRTMPEPIKASAQSLYIMFHSDELGTLKGFKAEWSSNKIGVKSGAKGYDGPEMVQLINVLVMLLVFGL